MIKPLSHGWVNKGHTFDLDRWHPATERKRKTEDEAWKKVEQGRPLLPSLCSQEGPNVMQCVCVGVGEGLNHPDRFHWGCYNQGIAFTALVLVSPVSRWSSWLPPWSSSLPKLSFTDLRACDRSRDRSHLLSPRGLRADFCLAPWIKEKDEWFKSRLLPALRK